MPLDSQTLPEIKIFFWLCNHERLATRNLLSSRSVTPIIHWLFVLLILNFGNYNPCQQYIRDCNFACNFGLVFLTPSQDFFVMDFRHWLKFNFLSKIPFVKWNVIFHTGCWLLWHVVVLFVCLPVF